AEQLRRIRAEPTASRATLLDAALAAFSGRIRLDESCERRPEEVIEEIFTELVDESDENPPPSRGRGGGGGRTETSTKGRVLEGLARLGPRPMRGYRRMVPRAGAAAGDLDLERTVERAAGRPRRAEDLVVRDWRSAERAACLLLDRSGSMRGHGLALAAVA